jgi:hypothetical protein
MARPPSTEQEKLLDLARVQAFLGHVAMRAGLFKDGCPAEIGLPDLARELIFRQGVKRGHRSGSGTTLAGDTLSNRKLGNWIRGKFSVGNDLDRTLDAWDRDGFSGSIATYMRGPVNSLLFDALDQPIESAAFYKAADINFEDFCVVIGDHHRLSGHIKIHLDHLFKSANTDPVSVVKYLTASVAWYRYAMITLHSVSHIVSNLTRAIELAADIEKQLVVNNFGVITYPINTNTLYKYLVLMTASSVRFGRMLKGEVDISGSSDWRSEWLRIAAIIGATKLRLRRRTASAVSAASYPA